MSCKHHDWNDPSCFDCARAEAHAAGVRAGLEMAAKWCTHGLIDADDVRSEMPGPFWHVVAKAIRALIDSPTPPTEPTVATTTPMTIESKGTPLPDAYAEAIGVAVPPDPRDDELSPLRAKCERYKAALREILGVRGRLGDFLHMKHIARTALNASEKGEVE